MALVLFFSFLYPQLSLADAKDKNFIHIKLWHQLMYAHRTVQAQAIANFEKLNPGIKIESVYKETEDLRSSYQAAALVGGGPELIYGPSDQVGPLQIMGLIAPMQDYLDLTGLNDFDPLSIIKVQDQIYMLGDTVGNHISLIYNKKLISAPPQNTKEMFEQGAKYKNGFYIVWPMQEPYFFVPWIAGFGGQFITAMAEPQLDQPAVTQALALVKKLKESSFVPKEADYETANALFKEGKAAMIINGDWSWGDYQKAGIDFSIARLPMISETKLWPSPLVATKGYSVNASIKPEKREAVKKLLEYLTSAEVQALYSKEVSTMPARLSVRLTPTVTENELLQKSADILLVGTPMPIFPELRAVWDSLRAQYQSVLGGSSDPVTAAKMAQSEALRQIKVMNEIRQPDEQAYVVKGLILLFALFLIYKLIKERGIFKEIIFGEYRLGYAFLIPAALVVTLVIVFPFFYNIFISFSNLSLKTFQDWSITGFHNYFDIFKEPQFFSVFLKTLLWTFLNLFFHVSIGLVLALVLDDLIPFKGLWRTLLIIPWAVPQYISALTWRGMFNQEFGPINQILTEFMHMSPVEWLSRPFEAFSACLLTNVWLGFPFMMMVTLGGLQGIPKELYEAARVDGGNALHRFRYVTWPLLQPVLMPSIVLGGIWTFNNLNVVWLVSNAGEPADSTHILVSYVYKSAFNLYRYGFSAALSVVIFLMLLLATLFYFKISKSEKGNP